jgi:hypothetical protein
MNFDVTTNRIPFGLLTPEEQATLKAWPHGVEYYRFWQDLWADCDPIWDDNIVYRGKPAPKVTSYWFNIYDGYRVGQIWTNQAGAASALVGTRVQNNSVTMRMQICNGEVTVTKEEA